MSMFCNQCQESAHNTGCTIKGVCGKTEDTAGIQDLVVYVCQGLAYVNIEARKQGVNTLPESRKIDKVCLQQLQTQISIIAY